MYSAKNEEIYGIVSFLCHVTLATFKNMWVTSGSHPDCSVGQWVKYVSRCDPLSILLNVANILLPTVWKLQQIKGTLLTNALFAPLSLLQYCIIYTHIRSRLVLNMLKNLPIIPSRNSQNFHLLFLFIPKHHQLFLFILLSQRYYHNAGVTI